MAEVTGVSLTDIIKQGHWSKASKLFKTFYRKNLKEYVSIFNNEFLTNSFEERRLE